MGELLPKFVTQRKEEESKERVLRQSRKVTDIITWVQCFSSFVAGMAPAEPQVIPKLMAYLNFVVRASQDYKGLSWMRYD